MRSPSKRCHLGSLMVEHYEGDDIKVRVLARGILAAYDGISVEDFEESLDGRDHRDCYLGARL